MSQHSSLLLISNLKVLVLEQLPLDERQSPATLLLRRHLHLFTSLSEAYVSSFIHPGLSSHMAQYYKQPSITESRVNVFLGWEAFNPKGNVAPGRMDQNLCGRLWRQHDRSAVNISVASTTRPVTRPDRATLKSHKYRPAGVGETFGPTFSTHLFRVEIKVPESMDGLPVHLLWDSNSEAMVISEDGLPLQGLVGGDSWCRRADFPLFPDRHNSVAKRGDVVRLYIEIACNGLFGEGRGGQIEPPDLNKYYKLEECCIAVFDPVAWGLIHDVTLLAGLAKHLPEGPRRANALNVANQVVNAVDVGDRETYDAGRKIAAQFLSKKNGEAQSTVYSMLHSHIDLAWLWPMAATPSKGARTFSTHLRLMELYPDCIFVQSQAQLYEWVKDQYPLLWDQICKRVKEGRFVPVGGTWVEMDCNIPSGESLVRQFLLGQNFFKKNFGSICKEFWLPDTFGYAAQLPQIMQGCGIDYFMTQKLSWNLFNKFPHSSFVWEGLDGTRVLAHMPPSDTYNAQAFPEEVMRSTNKNKDSGVISDAIMLVGHGDGGGGASPAMVESMRRMRDVDGVPRVKFSTPFEYFKNLEAKQEDLPRWVGELYFELHRGTYTTQAKTKLENRQSEILLQDAEMLSSLALLTASSAGEDFDYPISKLTQCWKLVLKNCFHDTLPGSCIAEVYRETAEDYAKVRYQCMEAFRIALQYIKANCDAIYKFTRGAKRLKTEVTNGHNGNGSDICDLHGLMICRGNMNNLQSDLRVIETCVAMKLATTSLVWQECVVGEQKSLLQKESNSGTRRVLLATHDTPGGFGAILEPRFLTKSSSEAIRTVQVSAKAKADGRMVYILENGVVTAEICETGVMDNLRLLGQDKPTREALTQKNGGNRLVVYDDVSQFWCGWDTEVYSFEKQQPIGSAVSCKIVETGPLRVALHVKYPPTKAGSTIEQYITLRAGSSRIDFRTEVDWKESRKILRVLFDTQVRSDYASYESQFGYVKRPTTFNHSWEIAKFEVVGHRFCDISEPGFGVALLNDCKYGYSVRDSTMRLSLLRASKSPDDTADIGKHFMTYAILPHWQSFPCHEVVNEATDLNCPPEFYECPSVGQIPSSMALTFEMQTDSSLEATLDTAVISAVKKSERDSNALVVRMYESMGARGRAVLRCPADYIIQRAQVCNMLDETVPSSDSRLEEVQNGEFVKSVLLEFQPFEIRSVALFFGELRN